MAISGRKCQHLSRGRVVNRNSAVPDKIYLACYQGGLAIGLVEKWLEKSQGLFTFVPAHRCNSVLDFSAIRQRKEAKASYEFFAYFPNFGADFLARSPL